MADTRGDHNDDLINTSVLTPIVDSILALSPAPKVVIFGGDAAYRGGTDNLTKFQAVFTDRLTAAGIPSAFAIGNHELYTKDADPLDSHALARQRDFQALFNGGWTQNGPPSLNNLAFSFHLGNSLFIIADSYYAPADGSPPAYGVNSAQQNWIKGLLQNDTASHTFVFTHIPAFSPSIPSAERDMADTWQTITTSGNATNTNASILFAGHEHLYYRTLHDGTYQVLAGSAGAPLTCDTCGPVQPGDVYALRHNYAVVSINGRYVTVNVFDPTNQTLDAFRFFDNSGAQNSVINNAAPIVGPQPAGILAGSGNIIDNSAAISNVDTGIDAVHNNTITNSGSITPSSGGNGIHVYDNNIITNTVAGSITGNSTDLWGIRVNTGNAVVNHGTVAVSGTNSIAFLAQGDSNALTNVGTLSASGRDSYAAKFLGTGNTLVNFGTISGSVWFDAGNNAFTNGGTFDGSGSLYKVNSGTLTLRGPTSYTGGTYLNGGVINVTQDASLGATSGGLVFGGGTLQLSADMTSARNATLNSGGGTFDTNGNSLTLSGAISGPGSLVVAGPGTFTFSGNGTYTGTTTINGGTTLVNGSLASSSVTVNPGATLGGSGTVGPTTIAGGGTLSPGNSIGTLTVNGNLSFNPASTYLVEVSPNAADRTNATGTANLAGTVQAAFRTGNYVPKSYTILSGAALTGTFGSLSASGLPIGLDATLGYAPTAVTLNLASVLARTPGLNGNQLTVASAIDNAFNGGGAGGSFANLYGTSAAALPSTFSQLSGEIASGAPVASFQMMGQFLDVMLDPFLETQFGDGTTAKRSFGVGSQQMAALPDAPAGGGGIAANPAPTVPIDRNWTVWGAGFGAFGTFGGNTAARSNRLDVRNGGGAAGVDYRLSPDTMLGVALSGGSMNWSLSGLGSGNGDTVQAGLYASTRFEDAYVSAALAYGWNDLTIGRTVTAAGLSDRLTANVDAKQVAGRVEAGRRFAMWPYSGVTPYGALQVQSFDNPSYGERDLSGLTGFALNYRAQTTTDTHGELGVRFDSRPLLVDGTTLLLRGRAAWSHEFDPDRTAAASFQNLPGAGFTVAGAPAARDAALVSAGVELKLATNASLLGKFDGTFSGRTQVYGATATLRVIW